MTPFAKKPVLHSLSEIAAESEVGDVCVTQCVLHPSKRVSSPESRSQKTCSGHGNGSILFAVRASTAYALTIRGLQAMVCRAQDRPEGVGRVLSCAGTRALSRPSPSHCRDPVSPEGDTSGKDRAPNQRPRQQSAESSELGQAGCPLREQAGV